MTTHTGEEKIKTTSKLASVMSVWAMFLCITAFDTTVHATNTFEDPMGRFVIDLPEGWKLEPQTVYVFKGTLNSNSIIMEYLENSKSAASAFNSGINSLKGAGLPNASAVREVTDLSINANPARWGVYSDELTYGSAKVLLYGLLGAVSLEKRGRLFSIHCKQR